MSLLQPHTDEYEGWHDVLKRPGNMLPKKNPGISVHHFYKLTV